MADVNADAFWSFLLVRSLKMHINARYEQGLRLPEVLE